ncbi:MAG: hypothetical protein U1F07_05260 [Rubrivivax sp.]
MRGRPAWCHRLEHEYGVKARVMPARYNVARWVTCETGEGAAADERPVLRRPQFYLEDLLGRPVDVVSETALRERLRPYVERDAIAV